MRLLRDILTVSPLIVGALCAFSGARLAAVGGSLILTAYLILAAAVFGALGIWLTKDEI